MWEDESGYQSASSVKLASQNTCQDTLGELNHHTDDCKGFPEKGVRILCLRRMTRRQVNRSIKAIPNQMKKAKVRWARESELIGAMHVQQRRAKMGPKMQPCQMKVPV